MDQNLNAKVFIGGERVDSMSHGRLRVVNPYTEQLVVEVPAGTTADVDRAVAAARTAFDSGPWRRMELDERMEVVTRLRDILAHRQDEIASLITEEMGCPITQSRAMQATGPVLLLDTFLELAPHYPWADVRRTKTGTSLVTRDAIGVVAAIIPWNSPLTVGMIKIAPALLAGCSVVVKPSPEAPLDLYLLAEAAALAGIPDGVVNVVPADRAESEYLVTHPDVDKVAFTGSTAAGLRIAELCGRDLRRVSLELGGKSAAVVLDDADPDTVMESVRRFSLRYNGQACNNKIRILLSNKRKAEMIGRLKALLEAMPIGDPHDPDTQIGPLVTPRQRERVELYIAGATRQGATLVTGGGRPPDQPRGWFVQPTLFADVSLEMTIAQEEVFGPVLGLITYESEAHAVAIANNSVYGLSGSVFSADEEHALAIARQIETGTVEVNGNTTGFYAPIGGFRRSGIGHEGGIEGFDEYVNVKTFGISPSLADVLDHRR
ncbi:aldehyde dehydrogenase [Rhodococcus wratislaviensis]|uniref:aldehyde dehydrogenase n=1 Tax=Rhodococcus wratislaviensis TaxID=44752 RepID=UPI00364B07DD